MVSLSFLLIFIRPPEMQQLTLAGEPPTKRTKRQKKGGVFSQHHLAQYGIRLESVDTASGRFETETCRFGIIFTRLGKNSEICAAAMKLTPRFDTSPTTSATPNCRVRCGGLRVQVRSFHNSTACLLLW